MYSGRNGTELLTFDDGIKEMQITKQRELERLSQHIISIKQTYATYRYELENIEVLDSLSRSFLRTSLSCESPFPKFAGRLVNRLVQTKVEEIEVWKKAERAYFAAYTDSKDQLLTEVFDLSIWIQSKVQEIPMSQVFENRGDGFAPPASKAN